MVHRRIKTREVFDLTCSVYLGLRRAAHHAAAAADAVALADSDNGAVDDGSRRRLNSSPLPARPRARTRPITASAGPAPVSTPRHRCRVRRPTRRQIQPTQRPCPHRRQRAPCAPSPSASRPAARSQVITQVARCPRHPLRPPPRRRGNLHAPGGREVVGESRRNPRACETFAQRAATPSVGGPLLEKEHAAS